MKKEVCVTKEITEEEIRSACDTILKSKVFFKAYRMQRLLGFLIDQTLARENGNTSEYVIGIEVFGRNPTDFVSEDPAIRVQIGRLRHRLASYYKENDPLDDIEISIPVGQHTPVFRRMAMTGSSSTRNGYLLIQPIRHIAERGEGQAFVNGLYEELLNQLSSLFGDVFKWAMAPSVTSSDRRGLSHDGNPAILHHVIDGSVRVDAERIRASIRLVDYPVSRITWARHFDRSVQFGIREQEELATTICNALREVVPN